MTTTDAKTFRGRSLEEVLPQVRAAFGPDAIVLRRREGLAGGVAGFFQRPFVEVEARGPEPRNDRATAEGLASPAIQALVEQASPFADALVRAEGKASPGLYGPQPNTEAIEEAAPERPAPAAPKTVPASPVAAAPPSAANIEARLVANGLSPALAADVVGEAVAHGLPFAQPRALKKLVRSALARRIDTLSDLGPGPRRIALVGAGGSGKSLLAAHLAAAYAAADAEVVVVALRNPDGGCDLAAQLEPQGVSVIAATDAEQAKRRLARRHAALVIVDTPAAGPGERAAVAALARDLRALDVDEVHLTLPATLSAAAADEQAAALAPLGLTHVALTHTDQTARPGAPVELAIAARRAVSYVGSREGAEPADAADLAQRLAG